MAFKKWIVPIPKDLKAINSKLRATRMDKRLFIAGDWGTSRLRLHLCHDKNVLDSKTGLGIGKLTKSPASTLFDLIQTWSDAYGPCPIYLSGMVGSNIGWVNTPYSECPASREILHKKMTHIEYAGHDIYIASGLTCTNPLGSPDVMRGEETQILGAMDIQKELSQGDHLLCLPGTHSKWVLLQDGVIKNFHTSMTGELYALLSTHSILIQETAIEGPSWQKAFERGVKRCTEVEGAALLHTLFEVRSRQLMNDLAPGDAAAYLSGMIIGRDISGACAMYSDYGITDKAITVIGAPQLTHSYKTGLDMIGMKTKEIDGATAAIAGLRALFKT